MRALIGAPATQGGFSRFGASAHQDEFVPHPIIEGFHEAVLHRGDQETVVLVLSVVALQRPDLGTNGRDDDTVCLMATMRFLMARLVLGRSVSWRQNAAAIQR